MRLSILLIAALVSLGACSSSPNDAAPEPEVVINDEGDFEGDYELHMANAQDYYDAGDFYRARDQFAKASLQRPDELGARLGEGFSLYHVGYNSAALGNLNRADKELSRAEKFFSELWTGEIPVSTSAGDGLSWKSALGLAMTWRALGSLDKMRIRRIDSDLNTATGKAQEELLAEQRKRDLRRGRNNEKARELFGRLAAMEYAAPDAIQNYADMELIAERPQVALRAYERYLGLVRENIKSWEERQNDWPTQFEFERFAKEAQGIIAEKRKSALAKASNVLVQTAEIRFRDGEYESALRDLEEARRYTPRRTNLRVPTAECLDRLGRKDEALEHIDRYLRSRAEMDANTRRALKLRARLAQEAGR